MALAPLRSRRALRLLDRARRAYAALPRAEVVATESTDASGLRVASARLALTGNDEAALVAATQLAFGRCVAALGGRPPSFALHFATRGVSLRESSTALSAAASLFSPSPLPTAGATVSRWEHGRLSGTSQSEEHLVIAAVSLPPHLRAYSLSGTTSAVPDLPDLRGALTGARPPQLLLLSSPAFAQAKGGKNRLAELASRLDNALPKASIAAVIAVPPAKPVKSEDAALSSFLSEEDRAAAPEPAVICSGSVAPQSGTNGYVGIGFSALQAAPTSAATPSAPPLSLTDLAAIVRLCFGSARGSGWSFSQDLSSAMFIPNGTPLFRSYDLQAVALAAAGPPAGDPETQRQLRPLFILDDVVLLPGAREELVIYEPRYRLLLRAALEASAAQGHAVAPQVCVCDSRGFGTLAAITGYNLQPDGRAHVALLGGRRFKVGNRANSVQTPPDAFGLAVAEVSFFDDRACESNEAVQAAEELRSALKETLDAAKALPSSADGTALAYLALERAVDAAVNPSLSFEQLGWAAAAMTPPAGAGEGEESPLERQRRWLESRDTVARVREVASLLREGREVVATSWLAWTSALLMRKAEMEGGAKEP